ncbi:MAG: hypothetical protein A2V65_00120 [Deltaproteobacteria bacterium RBG_13_49_15]|nr:MAG: hypothetical protein A2V65_00120 [Deltaproteobacteria bacterium RBG_13_49_15]
MPFNDRIDARIQNAVAEWKEVDRKKMFGGICYLYCGHMFAGVYKDYLILRLGEKKAKDALERPFIRPFDITGKPMKGWVMLEEQAFLTENDLKKWVKEAKTVAAALPPK